MGVARILGLLIALGPLALGPLGCGGPSGASAGASRARRDRAGGASIPLREVRAVALDSSRALVVAEALEGGPILAGVATIRGERWEAASLGLEPLPGVEGRPRALARGRRGALLLVDGEEGGRLVLIHDEPTLAIETLLTLEGEAIER
ncbi:MAG: hypothetical protein OEY14_15320, partial [Myxococcales bacterium]|nr:hypothetical protein [Myxococcales bacterium]